MAVDFTLERIDPNNGKAWVASWNLFNLSEGAPFPSGGYLQKSIQVSGLFSGARVYVEGSNDGKDFQALTDSQSIPLEIEEPSLIQIQEAVAFVRPVVVDGDEETNLRVTLLAIGT